MKKLKVIMFSTLCFVLATVFCVEVFAAVYLNINIDGNIVYETTEIGAKIFGTFKVNKTDQESPATYLTLSGSGTFEDDVILNKGKRKTMQT